MGKKNLTITDTVLLALIDTLDGEISPFVETLRSPSSQITGSSQDLEQCERALMVAARDLLEMAVKVSGAKRLARTEERIAGLGGKGEP